MFSIFGYVAIVFQALFLLCFVTLFVTIGLFVFHLIINMSAQMLILALSFL